MAKEDVKIIRRRRAGLPTGGGAIGTDLNRNIAGCAGAVILPFRQRGFEGKCR
jgi:hypothetical protein